LVRYILTKLHAATFKPDTTTPIDYEQLTVEHLAFQGQKKSSNVAQSDVARIGNLLLVTEKLNDAWLTSHSRKSRSSSRGSWRWGCGNHGREEVEADEIVRADEVARKARVRRCLELLMAVTPAVRDPNYDRCSSVRAASSSL
jgi:hypothetical protein